MKGGFWGFVTCFLVAAMPIFIAILAKSRIDELKAENATLNALNGELVAICNAQMDVLKRLKAEAAEQSERLAKAQTTAAKTRAQSEVRVQTILTASVPDDNGELAAWAAREAKGLAGRLAE